MTDFAYTYRLSDDTAFYSEWVDDVYYAQVSQELVVSTEGRHYLYSGVPQKIYDELVRAARHGSVGAYVNNTVKFMYGPSTEITKGRFWKANTAPVPQAPVRQSRVNVPDAVRTEVQYVLDGKVVFMKSTKPADQALEDYLTAVSVMGLDAELEAVHVYFK